MNEEVTQGKAARGGGLGLYISFLHPKKEKKNNFVEEKLQSMLKVRDLISFQLFVCLLILEPAQVHNSVQSCPPLAEVDCPFFFKSVMGQTPV